MLPVFTGPQLTEYHFIRGTQAPEQRKIIPEGLVVVVISQRAGDVKSPPYHIGVTHQREPHAHCHAQYGSLCGRCATCCTAWHLVFRVLCSSQTHARVQRHHAGLRPDPLDPEERLEKSEQKPTSSVSGVILFPPSCKASLEFLKP